MSQKSTLPTNRTRGAVTAGNVAVYANTNDGAILVDGGAPVISTNQKTAAIIFVIDGAGSVITTGVKGFLSVPFACIITGMVLLSSDSVATNGSIVLDIWKDTYANYPPTVADTITAAAKPTLSSAIKATDSTLTGWTTAIAAGDVLGFNVDSAATVLTVTLTLRVVKT